MHLEVTQMVENARRRASILQTIAEIHIRAEHAEQALEVVQKIEDVRMKEMVLRNIVRMLAMQRARVGWRMKKAFTSNEQQLAKQLVAVIKN